MLNVYLPVRCDTSNAKIESKAQNLVAIVDVLLSLFHFNNQNAKFPFRLDGRGKIKAKHKYRHRHKHTQRILKDEKRR